MNSLFFIEESSTSSLGSDSSSAEEDSLESKTRWKIIKAEASAIPLAKVVNTIPVVSTPDTIQHYSLLDTYSNQTRAMEWNQLVAKTDAAKQHVSHILSKFANKKYGHRFEDTQVPLMCIADRTRQYLLDHVLLIKQYYDRAQNLLQKEAISPSRHTLSWDCNTAFVDTFCSDKPSARHSIFWLHGPCGTGKTTWVHSFWHGHLGSHVNVWNHFCSKSVSISDICQSLSQFFDNAMSNSSMMGTSFCSPMSLVPIVLQNLDHTFELLSDKHQAVFQQHLTRLLLQYCSSTRDSLVQKTNFAVAYVTSSSKSKFAFREFQKRLDINVHSERLLKFLTPSNDTLVAYLRHLAVDGYPIPSAIQLECKYLCSYLKKQFHRQDVVLDSEAIPGDTQLTNHLPSISNLVTATSLLFDTSLLSIPSWFRACNAHILVLKRRHKNGQPKDDGVLESSTIVSRNQVETMDFYAVLSTIMWPQQYQINMATTLAVQKCASSLYGISALLKQVVANSLCRPCHSSHLSVARSTSRTIEPIDYKNLTNVEREIIFGARSDTIKLIIKMNAFGSLPEKSGSSRPPSNLARALHFGREELVVSASKRALEAFVACVTRLLWYTSIVKPPVNGEQVSWK